MPDIVVPVGSTNAPRYRYYTADLVTNTIIGELSLEDVNYERSLKAPGSFDGKITITDQTNSLDLYNATMPGKTAIYAVRDGVCAWGGIIWGRTYDMVSRSLTFSASEFTSYLNHRIVWKAYSQSFEAKVSKDKNKYALIESVNNTLVSAPAVGDKVRVSFLPSKLIKYTNDYLVVGLSSTPAAPSDPGQNSFYVDMPKLPAPPNEYYSNVTVTLKVDTYEYLRDLITNTLSDFENIQFPNEEITPGIRIPTTVVTKKLITTDAYNGVATLTTDIPHNLILGQKVEIANVDPMLDGKYAVAEIPSPNTFTYVLTNPVNRFNKAAPILLTDISSPTPVSIEKDVVQYRQIVQSIEENITHLKRTAGVVTLQLNSQHRFAVGDKIQVFIEAKKPALQKENKKDVNSFDYAKVNNTAIITDITSDTITFIDPIASHSNSKYNRQLQSVETPSKNIVKLANERPFLKVFPTAASHGYGIGEQVQISGVDGYNSPWTNPIFDGYVEIYDVSPGTNPFTINNYKIIIDPNITDNPLYQKDTLVYLYLGTTNPKFKAGDKLSVRDLDTDVNSLDVSFLNGIHTIEEDSALGDSGVGNQYYVYFRFNWDTVVYSGAGPGGKASVDGSSWIAYEPVYSEIRYDSTLKEPDATSTISKIEYVPAKGASSNKVTVITADRHNLLVGDTVFINYSKQEDKNLYGVSSATVLSVPEIDVFTYSVPKSPKSTVKDPIPSKKSTNGFVAKGGTVTRLKSSVGAPQPVQVQFTEVHSTSAEEGGIVRLWSADHGLSVGDSIIVDVDGAKDYLLENDREPAVITNITQNTFSYKTNNDIPTIDKMEVRGFGFTTDGGQEVVTFDLAQADTRTARTNTITKVKPKWHKGVANDNYVTYTTSANTTAQVGDKVIISGLVDTGNTITTTTTVTSAVSSLEYYSTDKSLALTFADAHKLPENTGFSESSTSVNINTVVLSGLPVALRILFNEDYVQNLNLSALNGKTLQVKKVVNSNTLLVAYSGPNFSFTNFSSLSGISGVISNKNTVAVDRYSLTQFNVAGTVDYVSGATFSVKYNFLSGTEGNGVNPAGVIGTEYTLSPNNGTASFAAKTVTNITANSIVNISGITDIKSSVTGKNIDYSTLNRTYRVIKVQSQAVTLNPDYNKNRDGTAASPTLDTLRVFVVNPLKTPDGEKTLRLPNYPFNGFDADFTGNKYKGLKNAKSEKWSKLSGTAYIDLGRLSADVYPIERVQRTSADPTVAVFTATGHGFEVGDYAEVNVVGKSSAAFNQGGLPRLVTSVPDANTFTFTMNSPEKVSHYAVKDNVVTLFFAGRASHNFVVGDTVTVGGLLAAINGSRVITSTGPYTISFRVTTDDVDKKADIGTVAMSTAVSFNVAYRGSAVPGAFIKRVPTVFSRTFGEFPVNAAIGQFDYSTNEYSGNSIENTPITGSSLNTVASILDKYSNGISGFEYRVDCNLELDINGNKNFTKTFVLIPIYPASMTEYLNTLPGGKLAVGQWAPPAAFGADKVVFEYPGNITNVNMTESAQDSATRMFVSSSGSSPGAAEIPYAAASDTTLLAAGWPLLDKKETATYPQGGATDTKGVDSFGNYDIETDLNVSANKFLYESKPPQGDITIGVNGSLTPVVGSYNPGDWCSIIVNDDFVKNRLNSPLEPRNDVIVRRIDSIKVSVPNNPAFPEMIDLKLVPDWQVDSIGK